MSALGCVTGRFQPVHRQHLELFETALADCAHLVVGVTNPDTEARHEEATSRHRHTGAANPFSYFERCRLLGAAVDERGLAPRVTVVPFDLTRPAVWPQYVPLSARQYVRVFGAWERQKAGWLAEAGYPVTVLDGDVESKVSSTDIRRLLAALDIRRLLGGAGGWPLAGIAGEVPPATVPLLAEFLDRRSMRQRSIRQPTSP